MYNFLTDSVPVITIQNMKIQLLLLLLCLPTFAHAEAQFEHTCFDLNITTGRYCIDKQVNSKSHDLIYTMHPKGSNAEYWQNGKLGNGIKSIWLQKKHDAPTVVTISFGKIWLLTNKNSRDISGLLDTFVNFVMPEVERKIGIKNPNRILLAESMGGFSAAELIMAHPELFSRAAMICPALSTVSPYESIFTYYSFYKNTPVTIKKLFEIFFISRKYFSSLEEWKVGSPLSLADKKLGPSTPPLYISVGDQDEYGFYDGANAFALIAKNKKVSAVVWHPLKGGHCVYDLPSIANFL